MFTALISYSCTSNCDVVAHTFTHSYHGYGTQSRPVEREPRTYDCLEVCVMQSRHRSIGHDPMTGFCGGVLLVVLFFSLCRTCVGSGVQHKGGSLQS